MKVINYKKVEDCLEGTNVRDLLLDEPINKEFIHKIGQLGKLFFYEEIEKPYFKLIVRGKYTIKGSESNNSLRVMLPENAEFEMIKEIIEYIQTQC